jgi:hypothetical protein
MNHLNIKVFRPRGFKLQERISNTSGQIPIKRGIRQSKNGYFMPVREFKQLQQKFISIA